MQFFRIIFSSKNENGRPGIYKMQSCYSKLTRNIDWFVETKDETIYKSDFHQWISNIGKLISNWKWQRKCSLKLRFSMSPKVTFYFFNLIITFKSLNFLFFFSRCYVLEHHLSFPKEVCSINLVVKRLRKKIFKKLQKTSCYNNIFKCPLK